MGDAEASPARAGSAPAMDGAWLAVGLAGISFVVSVAGAQPVLQAAVAYVSDACSLAPS